MSAPDSTKRSLFVKIAADLTTWGVLLGALYGALILVGPAIVALVFLGGRLPELESVPLIVAVVGMATAVGSVVGLFGGVCCGLVVGWVVS